MIKFNGSKITGAGTSNLINVADIVESWSSPYTVILIKKELVDFKLVETRTPIDIRGMVQNLSTQELELRPEGERNWKWYKLITTYHFNNDDVVIVGDKQFRIMGTQNEDTYYGYYRYNMVEDYKDIKDKEYYGKNEY